MKQEELVKLAQMQHFVYQQLQRSFEHGRLAHAYLLRAKKERVNMKWVFGWLSIYFVHN